uniref:Reverse transcriptase domain-containing protein n=1 Tax=Fagus sylvatica TaxID=28930 RepID=A0A2N9F7G7_FAGSY
MAQKPSTEPKAQKRKGKSNPPGHQVQVHGSISQSPEKWRRAGPPHHPVVHGGLPSSPQQTQSRKRSAAALAAVSDEEDDEEDEGWEEGIRGWLADQKILRLKLTSPLELTPKAPEIQLTNNNPRDTSRSPVDQRALEGNAPSATKWSTTLGVEFWTQHPPYTNPARIKPSRGLVVVGVPETVTLNMIAVLLQAFRSEEVQMHPNKAPGLDEEFIEASKMQDSSQGAVLGNKAAKMLAGYSKENKEPPVWLEEGPAFLLPIEKEGGRRGSTSAPNFLKEILFDLGAVDLSFAGNKFTWFNKRLGLSVLSKIGLGIQDAELLFKNPGIKRKKNTIEALKSDQGSWITEAKEIKKHLSSKFNELFKEDEVEFPADLHNLITPNISVEDNDDLCKIPSTEEINAALFDVVKAISSFFHSSKMFKEVNESLIVLIPKVPIPTTANNYRPIGLCNVVCKIIAKLLVDKLRPFLQRLISHCQSAFIPSRWIAENEVIVQELLHSFKQRKVKVGVIAVKLDLQKAYDRLNWPFLQVVLNKFGFDDRFIKWIMECVSSVSHTILVNGGKTDQIFPSRGVRQGDPLSPYLFIMCQDVLSRMLDREILAGRLSGVKASRTNPAITHIMYADDIVAFSKANSREATILTEWLEKYCSWSGQLINRNKSGVFFSKHTKKPMQRSLKCLLQMKAIKKDSFYLGSPMFLTGAKTKDFYFLLDKALPTYTMSTFEVPTTIWTKIDSATRRFWWNPKTSSGSHLALKSWEALCLPHKQGGLGFRKRKEFKMALGQRWLGW